MNFNNRKSIQFWETFLPSIRLGFSINRLERFRHMFLLDSRTESRSARMSYDYIVFRRRNSRFNQFILNFTFVLVLTLIPIKPLFLVWVLFQISEFACYWMAGRAELEIQNDCFNAPFWYKFKYIFNSAQFILTSLAFAVFSVYVNPSHLFPSAMSYLMIVVLSSSLNFFSTRFNLISLVLQLVVFVGFCVTYILHFNVEYILPDLLFFSVPMFLTFFAGYVGVWSYNLYYVQSLDVEQENYFVQEKLIENSRVLSREKHLIDRIQSTISEAIVVVDFRQKILQANSAFLNMFEMTNFKSGHINLENLVDVELLLSDGVRRSFQPNKNTHFIIQGAPLYVEGEAGLNLFVIIDVTDKVLSDQASTQSQKLNALGALSGGIAHDFNNILAVIKANADLINNCDDIDKIKLEYLEDILVSCDNARGLTRQILSFVRNVPVHNILYEPKKIAEETAQMIRNSLEPTHEIILKVSSNSNVLCDQNLFKNALINLILNARDSMPHGGVITIRIFEEGKDVIFSIEDTGEGIREEDIERVTEPFFSMKPNEKGTGIGLPIVKQFAEKSGGEFKLFSTLGKGTKAQIILPFAEEKHVPVEDLQNTSQEYVGTHNSYRVLVVDDNVMLAKSLLRQLQMMGHSAVGTHSLEGCQKILATQEFDLILCDIVLKAETGIDIWDYCQQNEIQSKFLYISGNVSPDLRVALAAKGPYRLIEKPIDFADLKQEIHMAINAH